MKNTNIMKAAYTPVARLLGTPINIGHRVALQKSRCRFRSLLRKPEVTAARKKSDIKNPERNKTQQGIPTCICASSAGRLTKFSTGS